jgi:hypothetical protein
MAIHLMRFLRGLLASPGPPLRIRPRAPDRAGEVPVRRAVTAIDPPPQPETARERPSPERIHPRPPRDDRRVRLGGVPGEGALVAVDATWARGSLVFSTALKKEVDELFRGGEPILYEGVLLEGSLATRIVGQVQLGEIREIFTGVEVEALFGNVPAAELRVHFRG